MGTVLLKELKVEIMFKDTLSATELLLFCKHILKKEEVGVRKMAQGLQLALPALAEDQRPVPNTQVCDSLTKLLQLQLQGTWYLFDFLQHQDTYTNK